VTRLQARRLGFHSYSPRPNQPPTPWVPGILFPEVKRPWLEAHQSPQSSAEVKNDRSSISIPLYVFMAWCLVKYITSKRSIYLSTGKTLPFTLPLGKRPLGGLRRRWVDNIKIDFRGPCVTILT